MCTRPNVLIKFGHVVAYRIHAPFSYACAPRVNTVSAISVHVGLDISLHHDATRHDMVFTETKTIKILFDYVCLALTEAEYERKALDAIPMVS